MKNNACHVYQYPSTLVCVQGVTELRNWVWGQMGLDIFHGKCLFSAIFSLNISMTQTLVNRKCVMIQQSA